MPVVQGFYLLRSGDEDEVFPHNLILVGAVDLVRDRFSSKECRHSSGLKLGLPQRPHQSRVD